MQYFTQKCSSFLVSRSSIIAYQYNFKIHSYRFFSGHGKDGVVSNDKGVREWEPKDPFAVNKMTSERLQNNQLIHQTQILSENKPFKGQQREVIQQTREMKFETQLEVDQFIQNNLSSCNIGNIAHLMSISVKFTKENRKVSFLKKHLPAILLKITDLSTLPWTFKDIAIVIYSLQHMTANDIGAIGILSVMTTVIEKSLENSNSMQSLKEQSISMLLYGLQNMTSDEKVIQDLLKVVSLMIIECKDTFGAQAVGNALYGLQGMSSDSSEVRNVLSLLAVKVRTCKEDLKAQHVGNALYGLQGMSSDYSEVRDVLSSLAVKVTTCKEDLKAQHVGNALYGLQGMSSDSSEVRDVLSSLAIKIRTCKEDLRVQAVGNALYGLQGMSSDSSEVRDVLSSLAIKIRTCKEDFDIQAVGNALYGLQGMSSDSSEVRDVLSSLAIKVKTCKEDLTAQHVSNALYGLQGMSSDCSEVRDVLSSLAIKVRTCKEDLKAQAVGNALYGLQGITWSNSSPDFIFLLSFLHRQTIMIVDSFSHSADLPLKGSSGSRIVTDELVTLCQSLTFLLPEISEFLDIKDYNDLEKLNVLISDELSCRKRDGDKVYKSTGFQSQIEKRMHKIATTVCQNTAIEVQNNVYLFGIFESDITLHIPPNGDSMNSDTHTIINIEVDGIHHKNEKKILFCRRKDKYLKSKGIFVFRMDISRMNQMKDIELEAWILSSISSVEVYN
jgi:hypothetical protein